MPYGQVIDGLAQVRDATPGKRLHVFGIGGTATLHLAALLRMDSADSAGWRNRAARGLVQLPGHGDRLVAELGSWRGRTPDRNEWVALAQCECPACASFGSKGLVERGVGGFAHRATHNLWTLLQEAREIDTHLTNGSYEHWYLTHVQNSVYRPLIGAALARRHASHS